MVVQVIHLYATSVTVTGPNATTLGTGTASIGDGVISRWTYASCRFRLQTRKHNSNVSGDGYADILPVGATVKTSGLSTVAKAGSSIVFSNGTSVSYIIVVSIITRKRWYNKFRSVTANISRANVSTHGTTAYN